MMTPKQLYFTLLGVIGVLTLSLGAGFVLGHQRLDSRISELEQLQADNVLANERIRQLEDLEANYEEIQPLAVKIRSILPTEKKQAEVAAQVEKVVGSAGLRLNSISFEATQGLPSDTSQTTKSPVGGTLVMPAQFNITGTYGQLQDMLRKFENQERYMRVKTLQINRSEGGELTYSVSLEVFIAS